MFRSEAIFGDSEDGNSLEKGLYIDKKLMPFDKYIEQMMMSPEINSQMTREFKVAIEAARIAREQRSRVEIAEQGEWLRRYDSD